uniref:Uncharacterized protein n=1 Tax=Panagrolaimus sp. PS1159 TaxID=55785 RepID=A0AC35FCD2_9BILA
MSLTGRQNVKIRCLSDLIREKQKKPDEEPMEVDEPMDCSNEPKILSSVNDVSNVIMSPIHHKINRFNYWIYGLASTEAKPIPLPSYQRLAATPDDDFWDRTYHDDVVVHSTPNDNARMMTPPSNISSIMPLSNQSTQVVPNLHENFDTPHSAHLVVHSTPLDDRRIITPPSNISSINPLSDESEYQSALARDNIVLPNNLNPVVHFNTPKMPRPERLSAPPFDSLLDSRNDDVHVQGTVDAQIFDEA